MKIKVSQLEGTALDWAVAKCEYGERKSNHGLPIVKIDGPWAIYFAPHANAYRQNDYIRFLPTHDWSQGGPIIEREQIEVSPWNTRSAPNKKYLFEATDWRARSLQLVLHDAEGFVAPTPLIAAMRCYVASKLGDEVDVPDELR